MQSTVMPADAQAYLAAIIESSDDAIISKNLDGVILSCNAAAERIFGYSAAELIGQPVRILIPADRQTEEEEILRRIRLGQRVDHFETVRVTKSGRPIDISLTVSAVRDASGTVVGASKVARDITETKRAAAALAEYGAERDRLLDAERTARAEAERASRIKDDFVAMVSHELRTPLNAILGWAQLMENSPQDGDIRVRGLDVIKRNTRLQAQLISDLLDISRIVAGKLALQMDSVDLHRIITDTIEATGPDAEAKGISIVATLDSTPSTVAGDAARLQQVVWNLLSNAIKFSARGQEVRVTLGYSGGFSQVVVSDDGPGISPEFLPHVFDRFNQADRTITRRFGGLGLGLAIVKHLVELHGGTVRAESAGEGAGATFSVVLPASVEQARYTPADYSTSADMSVNGIEGLHLLLVEDEPDTLNFLRRLFETHGAHVTTATTAAEAFTALAAATPDILVSDIGLPDVDGYMLMQQVRRHPTTSQEMPAIALTAYARAEDRIHALRAGYQAHIAKPVEGSELLATVTALMESRVPR